MTAYDYAGEPDADVPLAPPLSMRVYDANGDLLPGLDRWAAAAGDDELDRHDEATLRLAARNAQRARARGLADATTGGARGGAVLTADPADVVAAVRVAAAELCAAVRDYERAVADEADALVGLFADPASEAAREHLTAVLLRRDSAAARLLTGPDALAPQLLGLLASGRVAVTA